MNTDVPGVLVRPLSPELVAALVSLFNRAASPCFCRFWHFGGTKNEWLERCARGDENPRELQESVAAGDPASRGLVAIDRSGRVVGWMKLTARVLLPKLRALPVYRALDLGNDDTTFSIACILVDPSCRRQQIARALVGAAETWALPWGARAIEAYPRRSTEALHDEEAWQGPERVFVELGFLPVHDFAPYPVYRKVLAT